MKKDAVRGLCKTCIMCSKADCRKRKQPMWAGCDKRCRQHTPALRKIAAVDFDGTLCENDYPNIGAPITSIIQYVKRLKARGYILILWTCREGAELTAAIDWCLRHALRFDYHNENTPENINKYKNNSRKIFADVYIDDRAMHIREILHRRQRLWKKQQLFK